jgi:2,5-dihydroxypyridine 5,6-dioxygenase
MNEMAALMEGARNCVRGYSGVQEGESVLLWTNGSPDVDALVVEALAEATEDIGAHATVLRDRAPEFRLGEAPGRVAAEAIKGAHVVIHVFEHSNAASIDNVHMLRYMFEYGTRFTAVIANTRSLMTSAWARYPMDLYWELFRRSTAYVNGSPFHLIDANGTDLTGTFKRWTPSSGPSGRPAGVTRDGSWTFFPSGNVPLHPESPLNGRVVFDSMEGFGTLEHPIALTIDDHWVVDVEGSGAGAAWLRQMLERYENARYVCELTWGIHPKADLALGLMSRAPDSILYRHPGVWHVGLGMWPGSGVPSVFHWDGGGRRATLTIGDSLVIDAGRLMVLEDPELRRLASQYGDPEELLRVAGTDVQTEGEA